MIDKENNLVWIDLEMTGLGDEHVILEIASLVTDSDLRELATGPVLAIHRTKEELENINEWSRDQHTKSGLLDRVEESSTTIEIADEITVDFLKKWVDESMSPICGNSVGTDRKFIHREMPSLDKYLHYRMIDVSTIKELVFRWYEKLDPPSKKSEHMALSDIRESIDELRWYREKVFSKSK